MVEQTLWPISVAKSFRWVGESRLRKRRERIISPVEQYAVQQGTLQIGELRGR